MEKYQKKLKKERKEKMVNFKEIKEKLKQEGYNTNFFTKEFYDLFMEERKSKFDKIFDSNFYKKNAVSYCRFLELFTDNLKCYNIYGYMGRFNKIKINSIYAIDKNGVRQLIDSNHFKNDIKNYAEIEKIEIEQIF